MSDGEWSDFVALEGWEPGLSDFIHLVACPACGPEWWTVVRKSEMEGDESLRWRDGQRFFNFLYEVRPDLAEQLRGTLEDPFHKESLTDRIWIWLVLHWGERPAPKKELVTVDDLLADVLANHPLTGDDRPEGEEQ